jgi:prolyl 4-hydroxylase
MPALMTPEMRRNVEQWLVAQRAAGFDDRALYKALRDSGWDHLQACDFTGLKPASVQEHEAAPAVDCLARAVPWPAGAGEQIWLDAGDRQVQVLALMRDPQLMVLGHLLDAQECQGLIEEARPRLSRSLTVSVKTGGEEENADRTSQGMFFRRGESELIERIERRLARLLDWPMENGEGLQVLRYGPGAQYKPHYDYFDPQEPGTETILKRGGQRVATVVIYLNEPEAGGATTFPDAQFECLPVRGNAVFFNYSRPDPSSRSLHAGAPVLRGEKWIATKWLRERRFD